ncbi:HAD family hydrolase [Anaerobacillus isosaccharinicus]|uniref:Hydrolase n=1 Tax=Anaerobacillus isosaccharinicus TaxID=1532552 RepID=A0A1S2MFJ9_9BACI|nr:HAD family hydrolase [Anaerobacillus isosaccharinicus]MBA5587792.1 HAD family hydrolase [Anaerobacillus isosaccharinicus]QOY34051.1 HAD family hydrolase [Anaerobacillus isosaccharinicus]
MEQIFSQGQLFVFDLDGTLYEGTDHFDYYAERLLLDVAEENKDGFNRDYQKMKEGNHPVKIGKAYDVERDTVLTLDPFTLKVVKVETWEGIVWSDEKLAEVYHGQLTFDFEKMIAIGDGWWLPFAAAKHYGVKDCHPRYVETKEYMVTELFQLEQIPGVREGLIKLKETKKLVLVTNSDIDDVGRLLKELNLDGVFEHIVTSAKKPSRTVEIFKQLIEQYEVDPEQIVSVGDNFINEIAPAIQMGMKGIYIDPLKGELQHAQLKVVSSLGDCF